LESVKNIYGIVTRRDIDHPIGARFLPHPNFPDTRTDDFHWFPIVRVEALLESVDLKPYAAARLVRKRANLLQGASEKDNDLLSGIYQFQYNLSNSIAVKKTN